MTNVYLVDNVLYSGRKGERYQPVQDEKYWGLLGYRVAFDPLTMERGKPFRMSVIDSPAYEWWETSMILAAWSNESEHTITIETENIIYICKQQFNDYTDK